MTQLSTKIKLYAKANGVSSVDFLSDVILQDDGDGAYIKEWNIAVPQPELDELNKIDVSTELALMKFRSDRRNEYPSIGDQLDMQYHDQLDGTTTWKDAVAKVKADNPKPE